MSEVDRLSNSGLYPALPMGDRKRNQGESPGKPPSDARAAGSDRKAGDKTDSNLQRPPKSLIDDYA